MSQCTGSGEGGHVPVHGFRGRRACPSARVQGKEGMPQCTGSGEGGHAPVHGFRGRRACPSALVQGK